MAVFRSRIYRWMAMPIGRRNVGFILERKMKNKALFTSMRSDWKTPKALYQMLDAEFGFDFDPCPTKPKFDGLIVDWGNCNFCNPPYGRTIKKWIKKGYEEHLKGKTVIFLIPSRTDTSYWHDYIMKADEIRFIRGRLFFDDGNSPAPFPSAVAIFRSKHD